MDNFNIDNAVVALDAFRGELLRIGTVEVARPVMGLEIHDTDDAKLALQTIRSMKVPESLDDLRWMTVSALQAVANQGQQVA